jgi:hypothetical protein
MTSRLAASGLSDPESFGEADVIHTKKSEAKVWKLSQSGRLAYLIVLAGK